MEEKKSVCESLCICLSIQKKSVKQKKIFEKIKSILDTYQKNKELSMSLKKEKNMTIYYFWPYKKKNLIGYILEHKIKNFVIFSIRYEQNMKKKINEPIFKNLSYPFLKEILKILNEMNIETSGFVCGKLLYDNSKYELIGGLKLPIEFPIEESVGKYIGNASLTGMELDFTDSKIGLEELDISQNDKHISLFIRSKYKTKKYLNIVNKNYMQVKKISDMLLKRK